MKIEGAKAATNKEWNKLQNERESWDLSSVRSKSAFKAELERADKKRASGTADDKVVHFVGVVIMILDFGEHVQFLV